MSGERTFRPMMDHSYFPTDAGILQSDRDRREAARIGSLMLLERIRDLLAKEARRG